jgi:chitosanase
MRFTLFPACLPILLLVASSAVANSVHHFSRRRHHARSSDLLAAAAKWNNANSGTPVTEFTAKAELPVAKLAAAALKAKKADQKYPVSDGSKTLSTIYTDWANFKNASAYVWTADMDVDCDGIDFKCSGNTDGQKETDFGALAAFEVPWVVIPGSFVDKHSDELPGNNVVAVICNGNMFYGIFGDTNGDTPEVIGEASWRMARACFPNSGISGNNGHAQAVVTYIAFTGKNAVLPKSAMTTNYITQFEMLKTMGDNFVSQLATHLNLH